MRFVRRRTIALLACIAMALIAIGLLARVIPPERVGPNFWAWMDAHPGAGTIIDFLALIATVVSLLLAYREWKSEKERDRTRIQRPNFPFEAVTPEELPAKFPTLPLADQAIGYLHRLPPEEQEEMQHLLDNTSRLLIRGRTGLGKSVEAIALVQRLAVHKKEPITVLLPKPPLTLPPFIWPLDLPTRTIILFLDRVEENWGFAAPESKERMEVLAVGDLRGWLPQAVAHLENRFKGSDFRVIATVRDDPAELWERIEPQNPFWRGFTKYRLPAWEKSQREELCKAVADWLEIGEVEKEALQWIVERCEGTPASIITFLKDYEGAERLSLAEARKFDGHYPNDWERIWRDKIAPYPAARYLFAALSILNQARVTPYKYLAVRLAARLWEEHFAWRRELEVKGRHGLKWVESWVPEEDGILKCPEARLEGRGDLRANATLLTNLLLAASRERGRAAELLPSLFNFAATLQIEVTNSAEAERLYNRVIQLDPHLAQAYYNLGLLLAQQPDRLPQAEDAYRRAIQLDPHQAAYWNGLGNALHALKQYQEAAEAYSQAIAAEPEEAMYLRNRADTYIELGRLEEAEQDLEKAKGLDPDNAYLFARYGQLHLWREEFDQSIAMCREAQGRGLKEAWGQFNRALATLCQGKLEEARKEYMRGIEMADKQDLEGTIEDLERMRARRPGLEGAEEIMKMLCEAKTQGASQF